MKAHDHLAWLNEHWESDFGRQIEKLPSHMRQSVACYVAHGWPIGGFLVALFSDQLVAAFNRADDDNAAAMQTWVRFIYNHVPTPCWGNPEKVAAWQEAQGFRGASEPQP